MSKKYNMKEMMQEREHENQIDRILNKLQHVIPEIQLDEYVFELKYDRKTQRMQTHVAMPPNILAQGIAMTISDSKAKDEDLVKFLQDIYDTVQHFKKQGK